MSGSNPPSTNGPSSFSRRVITTTAAAIGAVLTPVLLVALTAGVGGSATPAAAQVRTPASVLDGQRQILQARAAGEAVAFNALAAATTTVPVATTLAPTTTTTAAPAPPPPPPPAPVRASGDPNDPASWDRLAACESSSNWAANTGNGYYGGIQFSLSSWQAVGGTGYPHENSRETQIAMGQRLHAQGGWQHWPGCARSFGWI